MNLVPQGIVGWGGGDLRPLPMVAQHVDMSESVHTPAKKDRSVKKKKKKKSLPSFSHLSVSYLHPPLQVKWNDLMCGPVGVGNGVGG